MINEQDVNSLLERQLQAWPMLRANYEAFGKIETKEVIVDGETIRVQFNPQRISSARACLDPASAVQRKCFLCTANRPPEQESPAFGNGYLILCNPYPIFPRHFTIPTVLHTDQVLAPHFGAMLDLARTLPSYTIFYNGPKSGASAPDHIHFQAVTKGYMPIDHLRPQSLRGISGSMSLILGTLRPGILLRTADRQEAMTLFTDTCKRLGTPEGNVEPMMNVFCNYESGAWTVKLIPRRRHRPDYFFAEGEAKLLTSPGAADIGGTFITIRREDFNKTDASVLKEIYRQVCYTDDEIMGLFL